MTQAGMILGTAAYMAPEQARGAIVDKRADSWAFGVVLYEMLTGQRLFDGETVSDTLASVLKTDVDWSRLPNETPASVRRLLRHCLARDRKQRLQDIGDARLELSEGGAHDVVAGAPAGPARTPWLRLAATFVAGAALTFAGGAAWTTGNAPTAGENSDRAYTFLITPADGVALEDPPNFAVSPNGRSILLRGFDRGIAYWYVKDLSTGALRRLNSTQGTVGSAAWSPDSDWVLFSRQSALHKLAIDDTRLEAVSNRNAAFFGGASWSPSGDLLRVTEGRLIAFRAPSAPARTVIEASETLRLLQSPWALPDGKQVLIGEASDPTGEIFIAKLDGSEPPRALEKGGQPAFAAPNWLLAVRGQQLLAWRFDPVGTVVEGPPNVISTGMALRSGLGGRQFSVSQTGVLAVRNEAASEVTQLTWFDRRGTEGAQLNLTRQCRNPELSRDYQRVAMECYDGANRDIWLYDLARDAVSRFTTDPADDADPVWSPDGRTIAFSSNRKGAADVFRKSLGGATSEELMIETPGSTPVMAWSPDGKSIVVLGGSQDLIGYEAGASPAPTPIVEDAFTSLELQFSPDGRFISYSSDESGRAEIYVQPWPQTGERWQVSTDGATDARWRADGRELFYLSPTRELMAVSLDTRNGFRAGTPVRLFQTRVAGPLGAGHRFPFAVSADGQRFLIYVNDRNAPPPSISVIVNWPALIKK
ncbi:MAG: hypothetical protein EXQ50_09815 [Acidobacteria bacterium]|nr:hypothetical protein [Acidobacteriota bacterium]